MTNEQCTNVAETAWNLANESDTDFAASVSLRDCAITIKDLQARIAELEKDDVKNKVDAECFRWWVHEAAANPSLVAKAISHCITEDEYRDVICGAIEAKNAVINTAMLKD